MSAMPLTTALHTHGRTDGHKYICYVRTGRENDNCAGRKPVKTLKDVAFHDGALKIWIVLPSKMTLCWDVVDDVAEIIFNEVI